MTFRVQALVHKFTRVLVMTSCFGIEKFANMIEQINHHTVETYDLIVVIKETSTVK